MRMGRGKSPGGQFPRVSGHSSRRGARSQNGRGQVSGGQPRTPINPPFEEIDGCSIGRKYLPTAPKPVRLPRFLSGLREPGTPSVIADW